MTAEEARAAVVKAPCRPKLEDAVRLAKLLGITDANKLFELLESLDREWQTRFQID